MSTRKAIKNEGALNLNLAVTSDLKSLAFPLICVNENFENYDARAFIIVEKVNGIVKINTNAVNMLIIDGEKQQQKVVNTSANRNIFIRS